MSGSLDRTLRVWDLSGTKRAVAGNLKGGQVIQGSGTCTHTLSGHKDYVLSVGVTPDGQWVVSGSKDRSIQFWNVASDQAHLMLQGHKNSGERLHIRKKPDLTRANSDHDSQSSPSTLPRAATCWLRDRVTVWPGCGASIKYNRGTPVDTSKTSRMQVGMQLDGHLSPLRSLSPWTTFNLDPCSYILGHLYMVLYALSKLLNISL